MTFASVIAATAATDESTGEAAVTPSRAAVFTDTTASFREEIDRMRLMPDALRKLVAEADAQRQAAAPREADRVSESSHMRAKRETSHAGALRLRAERDAEQDKGVLQQGEIRQLEAVIEAHPRVSV